MPIWGALLAFTGLFVIYFIVLKCTSTKKSDESNAEIEKIEENKAFDADEKPEVQNDTEGRVSASEFKIISRKLHYSESGTKTTNNQFFKWAAISRWSSSLYCPKRNSNKMTIRKTNPTLYNYLPD